MSTVDKCNFSLNVIPEQCSISQVIDGIVDAGTREHPLHVVDLDDVVAKHLNWLELMARVHPFYAVKCNDETAIVDTLAKLGTGFDCASQAEMQQILDLGVEPERIIFAHPIKSRESLQFAKRMGVYKMTVDNEDELLKVKREFPAAKLVLRIRHDSDNVLISLGKKFGCDAQGYGLSLVNMAKELGLEMIGVSFHVGCGTLDSDCFYNAIKSARTVFDYAATVGYRFTLLDVGGGFPGDNDKPLDKFADAVQRGLHDWFPNTQEVDVIAEPGRYYVGSAATLLSTIQGRRVIRHEAKKDRVEQIMYYINDGIFGTLFDWLSLRQINDLRRAVPTIREAKRKERSFPTTIWGPTCDSTDIVCEDIEFPEHNIGDYIIFENLGAYGMTFATTFNGFPKPTVQAYMKENTWAALHKLQQTKWKLKTLELLREFLG